MLQQKNQPLLKIKGNYQVTLPAGLRRKYRIAVGDYLKAVASREGIMLMPIKIIDSSQEWFWKEKWQEKEAEADRDLAAGAADGPFGKKSELAAYLKKIKRPRKK